MLKTVYRRTFEAAAWRSRRERESSDVDGQDCLGEYIQHGEVPRADAIEIDISRHWRFLFATS